MPTFVYCTDCGEYMDHCESLCYSQEIHYELENHPVEWLPETRCIYCGSENLEETFWCERCDNLFPISERKEGMCPVCYALWEAEQNK